MYSTGYSWDRAADNDDDDAPDGEYRNGGSTLVEMPSGSVSKALHLNLHRLGPASVPYQCTPGNTLALHRRLAGNITCLESTTSEHHDKPLHGQQPLQFYHQF